MTLSGLLVDTDVLVDFLRDRPAAVDFLARAEGDLGISSITVAELFAGARNERERETLASFVDAFRVIPVDRSIAERGGSLRRSFGPSHGTGLADALIAATAQEQKLRLVTLNQRHFPMIEHLVVPYARS